MDESPLIDYYRRRAEQSGGTYGPPEIQKDFEWISAWLRENVADGEVLEVACGTGHWTKVASESARSIVASDISWDLVRAARKQIDASMVDFFVCDALQLPITSNTFTCGMAHFLLSHVRRAEVRPFVDMFRRCLKSGGCLLFTDTKWVDGYRKPVFRRDAEGNTYDLRTLKDGSRFEILKNYFTWAEWQEHLASFGRLYIEELEYVWAIKIEPIRQ
jgi:demethylmenaquinone methyltransferase/2-methoxy-6-polyprenyl-1,4-benzoquinol methylase